MTTLTIVILTLNEAQRIEQCVRSALFADQVVVIDSGSIDGTQALAQQLGAQVHEYADWKGFAEQRNRSLPHIQSDYVFFLDADEEITPQLQAEIQAAVISKANAVWEVVWNQVAFGKPLSRMAHAGAVRRMFRTASLVRFEGLVHEHAVTQGDLPTFTFKSRLLHYSRESVYGSLLKLAQYTQLGAAKRAQAGKKGGVLRGLGSAFTMFVKSYIGQRGFMCGGEGFLYCYFLAQECFFRYVALKYDTQHHDQLTKRNGQ